VTITAAPPVYILDSVPINNKLLWYRRPE